MPAPRPVDGTPDPLHRMPAPDGRSPARYTTVTRPLASPPPPARLQLLRARLEHLARVLEPLAEPTRVPPLRVVYVTYVTYVTSSPCGSPPDLDAVLRAEVARETARLCACSRGGKRVASTAYVAPSPDEMDDTQLAVVGVSCELQMGVDLLRACDDADQVTSVTYVTYVT